MGMPQCNIVLTIPVKILCAYDANIMIELKKKKRPNIVLTIPAKILCAYDDYIIIELRIQTNPKQQQQNNKDLQ